MGTGRRLEVAGHLTVVELFERYRGAEDAAVKAHFQVIWLKAQGWRTSEVARSTGFNPDWGPPAGASVQQTRSGKPRGPPREQRPGAVAVRSAAAGAAHGAGEAIAVRRVVVERESGAVDRGAARGARSGRSGAGPTCATSG